MESPLFKDKRSSILWLRWLLIIALSYLLLFRTGSLDFSWQVGWIIPLAIISNLILMILPGAVFSTLCFDRILFVVDTLFVSMSIVFTEFSSGYLIVFFFLIILMTTQGKDSRSVLINGIVFIGVYLLFLIREYGMDLFHKTDLLIHIPFLMICSVFYAVLVQQAQKAQQQLISKIESTEETLSRSEKSFRALIEGSPDAVLVHREGELIYVNPAAVFFLGYDHEKHLLGQAFIDLIAQDNQSSISNHLQDVAEHKMASLVEEVNFHRRDAGQVQAEIITLEVDFYGKPAMMSIARDITERKKMRSQMLLADRIASMGLFSAGIGHEINNPLSYVMSNINFVLQSLHDPVIDPGELKNALKDAQQGARRIRNIVRNLKVLSGSNISEHGFVDLQRVIELSVAISWNEIRHRAHLVKNYAPVPLVEGNEAQLGQIFLNLLVNAAQAMPEGKMAENEIRITTMTDDSGSAVVEVSDSGPGIPEDIIDRIFDPFFTTKSPGFGTGLGLSICHKTVAELGGKITVRSEEGAGASFRVVLPAAPVDGNEKPVKETDHEICAAQCGRILVIDDEAMICTAIQRTLTKEHDVTIFTQAREALERIRSGEHFDVILCDLMMPEMSGMEFYDEFCRIVPDQHDRIIFLTGGAFTFEARKFLAGVKNKKIEKPFDPDALRILIRERL